jgi:hypothetical protein
VGVEGFEPKTLPIASGCCEPAELNFSQNQLHQFFSGFPGFDFSFPPIGFRFVRERFKIYHYPINTTSSESFVIGIVLS